jgi:hypothetical protein
MEQLAAGASGAVQNHEDPTGILPVDEKTI